MNKRQIWIGVFLSTDGHGCSQPVLATSWQEAENVVRKNEADDSLELEECYPLTQIEGYKVILRKANL